MRKRTVEFLLFPLFLIILNFILKIIWLDSRDIAMDEPFSIFYAQVGFSDLFDMLKTENNPPLHFIFLHYWIRFFGISAFAVRVPSVLFSIASAFTIYQIGRKFFSFRSGVIASLLFTFSNYHQLFAHEARVYPLFALLSTLSMFLFLSMIRDSFNKRYFFLLILVNILLIYSHFFGFFILLIQFVCCIWITMVRKGILKKYCWHLVALFILYLPYMSFLLSRFWVSASYGTWVSMPLISDLYTMVWRFSNTPVATVVFLGILMLSLVRFIVEKRKTNSYDVNTKVLVTWFFLPYLLMFLISFKVPVFFDRYVIFISLGYYLLIGVAISYLCPSKKLFIPVAFIAVCIMLMTFHPNIDNKRRIKDAVEKVKELKGNDGVVYICPAWLDLGFTYYYNRVYFEQFREYREKLKSDNIFPVNDVRQVDTTLIRSAGKVVYFEEWATVVDKENRICRMFEERFRNHRVYRIYESFRVHEFTR